MTDFVAAWAAPGHALPKDTAAVLTRAIAPAGPAQTVQRQRAVVAWFDDGIWPGPSAHEHGGGVAVVCGDPVLVRNDRVCARAEAVPAFAADMPGQASALLTDCQGTFAALALGPDDSLRVATDKLAVRPVYWARVGHCVYVATTQWLLASLAVIDHEPDLTAAVETCAFGAPLGDRTLNRLVQSLAPGHLLCLDDTTPKLEAYWRWEERLAAAPASLGAPEALVGRIAAAFDRAIADRVQGQDRVFAFLSGGMDSRLIVAGLKARDVGTCTLNFAPPGSQDLLYGRMAAQAAGTVHFEYDDDSTDFTARRNRAMEAWDSDPVRRAAKPAQTRLVWSGDGGSVGLGHVYLDENMVALARSRGNRAAAQAIQQANRFQVSAGVFGAAYRQLADWPLQAIEADLSSRPGVEPGRNVHLFFMFNDQRRHLVRHFETLHQHGLDLVLPFFDARFIETVLTSPVDPFLLHRLYNDLMLTLPAGLGQVPWQAYPGHVPCPVPGQLNARGQWQEGWYSRSAASRARRKRAQALMPYILGREFPAHVLSRPTAMTAAVLLWAGVERWEYLLNIIGPMRACTAQRA